MMNYLQVLFGHAFLSIAGEVALSKIPTSEITKSANANEWPLLIIYLPQTVVYVTS